MIHIVTITPTVPVESGEEGPFFFASLDGEHYIGVSRRPEAGEEEAISAMLEGDGNFKPMTIAPGYLKRTAREFWGTEAVCETV